MSEFLNFIKKAEEFSRPYIEENRERVRNKVNNWNENNREKLKESQEKYFNTEKGKKALVKVGKIRRKRIKLLIQDLTEHELEEVKDFYLNCPEGLEVDHIIPVSKGGSHKLSNLQYLTRQENSKKASKIINITPQTMF